MDFLLGIIVFKVEQINSDFKRISPQEMNNNGKLVSVQLNRIKIMGGGLAHCAHIKILLEAG